MTSATPYLRKESNPNIRLQDGYKFYLLSQQCEDKFSKYEKLFAEKHFQPTIESNTTDIEYNEELFYFVSSVLWRFIITNIERYKNSNYYETLLKCENQHKNFLLEYKYPYDFDKFYIIMPFGYIHQAPNHLKGINHFSTRNIDCQIIYSDCYCFFYLKMPYFIFISNIEGLNDDDFQNSRIQPQGGFFNTYLMKCESNPIGQFIEGRIKFIDTLKMSENQVAIIEKDILKNIEEFKNKQGFETVLLDYFRDNLEN